VLRLVFGLGTRAVEQHGNDYTRIVAINAPLLRPEATFEEVRKHTQKIVDVLDLKDNVHASIEFADLAKSATDLPMEIFASNDTETEERAKAMNLKNIFTWILTFDNLLSNTKFISDMQKIMKTLENAYKHPVDIEFTGNFIDEENYRINIVQCRPFQFTREVREIQSPKNVKKGNILLKTCGPIIGQSVSRQIHRIIYVLPSKYGEMSMQDRYSVASIIGSITNLESPKGEKPNILLIGPGRWGTKMPALGIPVSFAQIKNASVLCEIVTMHEGLTPDISLGTHFFNDLVEMEILYMAIYPKNKDYVLNESLLMGAPNKLATLLPDSGRWADSIYVADSSEMKAGHSVFMHVNALVQKGIVMISK
jgi:pyruvate,water dikinase